MKDARLKVLEDPGNNTSASHNFDFATEELKIIKIAARDWPTWLMFFLLLVFLSIVVQVVANCLTKWDITQKTPNPTTDTQELPKHLKDMQKKLKSELEIVHRKRVQVTRSLEYAIYYLPSNYNYFELWVLNETCILPAWKYAKELIIYALHVSCIIDVFFVGIAVAVVYEVCSYVF